MKFETFTSDGSVVLPEKDRLVLLRYHLHAALGIADNLGLAMAGIHIDQAVQEVEGQDRPPPADNDCDPGSGQKRRDAVKMVETPGYESGRGGHLLAMALPPPIKTDRPSELSAELDRLLDLGAPAVVIGQWVAVNQSVIQVALQALAAAQPLHDQAHVAPR